MAGDEFKLEGSRSILATDPGGRQLPGLHRAAEAAVPGVAQLHHRLKEEKHGPDHQPLPRLRRRLHADQPAVLLHRLPAGHADRRAARHRPGRHHRHAAAGDLRAAAGVGADHAGRHLLRRAVRRLHHRHPGQPAGRIVLGGDRDRRLPDGKAGPRRPGAGGRRPGLVLRRLRRHPDPGRVRRAADRSRLQVRPGRILLADGAGPDRRRGAGFRLADQGHRA